MKRLAIIGGGAAGLAAAVAAGEAARGALQVTVYEADDRVGRSILATGNGRCNFSNAHYYEGDYHNGAFVGKVFLYCQMMAERYVPSQRKESTAYDSAVRGFFADHGLMWREESEGRLYPLANKASSVLDVLRTSMAKCEVDVRCNARVQTVEPPCGESACFTLRMADGVFERADAVIVAVGGKVARELLPEVLPFKELRPVLGPLETDTRWVKQLDNIRVKGALELHRSNQLIHREEGEILFRKYGVSGISVFNMSRYAQSGDVLHIDFIPWIREIDLAAFLNGRRKRMASVMGGTRKQLTCGEFLNGIVLPQVAQVLLESAGLKLNAPYEKGYVDKFVRMLKHFELTVQGVGDAKQCQVHRGGFDVAAFDERSCAARDIPGLYVVGEALDVDAMCGGFNLHWAWASGLLAGWSAVDFLG